MRFRSLFCVLKGAENTQSVNETPPTVRPWIRIRPCNVVLTRSAAGLVPSRVGAWNVAMQVGWDPWRQAHLRGTTRSKPHRCVTACEDGALQGASLPSFAQKVDLPVDSYSVFHLVVETSQLESGVNWSPHASVTMVCAPVIAVPSCKQTTGTSTA
jgi:hypothetical protein